MKCDSQVPETRLIDCIARRLVPVGYNTVPRPRFVALSYVWGEAYSGWKEDVSSTPTPMQGILLDLPLTIEDAITVTKALGFQYLWVDQYCIDQGDAEDKKRQVRYMDRIYQCADITIVAAAGDDCHYGIPGVGSRRRDVLDPLILNDILTLGICYREYCPWSSGRWHTRGWTFQEAHLSRRRLVFSDTGMHFECS